MLSLKNIISDIEPNVSKRQENFGVKPYILCDLDPKVKIKGWIICFLVITSPPKSLEVATSNLTDE